MIKPAAFVGVEIVVAEKKSPLALAMRSQAYETAHVLCNTATNPQTTPSHGLDPRHTITGSGTRLKGTRSPMNPLLSQSRYASTASHHTTAVSFPIRIQAVDS